MLECTTDIHTEKAYHLIPFKRFVILRRLCDYFEFVLQSDQGTFLFFADIGLQGSFEKALNVSYLQLTATI